jgi:hypothetical protein
MMTMGKRNFMRAACSVIGASGGAALRRIRVCGVAVI